MVLQPYANKTFYLDVGLLTTISPRREWLGGLAEICL